MSPILFNLYGEYLTKEASAEVGDLIDTAWSMAWKLTSTSQKRVSRSSESLWIQVDNGEQILAYVDDVNLIGDDIRTIEVIADELLNAFKDIGLAENLIK